VEWKEGEVRPRMLKKKASVKLSGRAFATEPGTSHNRVAKTTFTDR
jgi:hypothetical protein